MPGKILIILLSLCLSVVGHAQWRGLRVTEIGPAEGLNARVRDMVQDSYGYVYLASLQGLIRYDGSEFELFAHDPADTTSIASGEVLSVILGSDSLIWMGTKFGGLCSFDPRHGKFTRYPVPQLSYFTVPSINGLLEDADGTIWAGGHHFQLLLFDRETGQFTAYQPDWIDPEIYGKRLSIDKIIQDRYEQDILWLSVVDYYSPETTLPIGGYGVIAFNKRSGEFESYPNAGRIALQDNRKNLLGVSIIGAVSKTNPDTKETTLIPLYSRQEDIIVRDIIEMKDEYWIVTAKSIQAFTLDGGLENLYEIDDQNRNYFISLSSDKSNNIWITCSQGVRVVDPEDQHIRYFSLAGLGYKYRVYPGRLAYDEEHNIVFMSHRENWYCRIPLSIEDQESVEVIQRDYNVTGIVVDTTGKVWMTGNGDLHVSDTGLNFSRYNRLGFNAYEIPWLWGMRKNHDGWIGGLGIDTFFWFHPSGADVRTISISSLPGWKAFPNYREDFSGFKFSRDNLSAYLISGLVHHVDLISGESRLLEYDKSLNPYGQELLDIEEGLEDVIWIAGYEYLGKFKLKNDSLILLDRLTVNDGLVSAQITELQFDDSGRLWIFTDSGMNCVDTATNEIRYFGLKEGLPDVFIDPREVIKTKDGRFITVNATGIIEFHPDSLWHAQSSKLVSIVIKEIRVNGEEFKSQTDVRFLEEVNIPLGRNVIDIAFQGLAYPKADKLRYSYRLKKNAEWIDIGKNKLVTLPDLSPGEYTFEVKASAGEGDAPVRSLKIFIPTPFYLKPWFLILAGSVFLGGILFLYRLRINLIKQREEKKTEINKQIAELELKALRSQMNPHFMFNSLNSIKDFILHAQADKAAEYLSEFAHLIRLILQNSHQKTITLREELETLMIYIELEQLRFDGRFEFNCIVDDSVSLDDVNIPPMLLQPYIENAIWHGLMHRKEEGNLTIHFSKNGEKVICTIDDDGVGRARAAALKSLSATHYKSMGMGITKDRIDIINSIESLGISVDVEDKFDDSGQPAGTRVVLSIPVRE